MVIYRPHRELLEDAMKEVKEFNTFDDMKEHVVKTCGMLNGASLFTVDDVVINEEYVNKDDRIGWQDSMYVCIKRLGNDDYMKIYGKPQCIGMCATVYMKNKSK